MALIGLCSLPVLALAIGVLMPGIVQKSTAEFRLVAESMAIAEETLGSIRTVKVCCREDEEKRRFLQETLHS
jgi:ABC-type bacteriocin/lantibiotic exporter with double-glycine peptidase domain